MGVRQKSDSSAKVRNAHDGDEIFNYATFKENVKKYFDSVNTENNTDTKPQTSQETKPSTTRENYSENKHIQPQNSGGDNSLGRPKTSFNPLAPITTGIETLALMKTELGYSAKPIYQTMVRGAEDFLVDQYRGVVGAATGNQMPQGKEYRMATSVLGLGNEIFLSTAFNMKAETVLNSLKTQDNGINAFSLGTFDIINNYLKSENISVNDKIKLSGRNDIKNLSRQMDIYASRMAKAKHLPKEAKDLLKSKDLSKMTKSELDLLYNQLTGAGQGFVMVDPKNAGLVNMINVQQDMKKVMNPKIWTMRNPNLLRRGSRILKTAMEDNNSYKGYRKTKETYSMAKLMMKATLYEGKGLYKTTKVIGNAVTKGGEAALRKVGLEGAANVFAGVNDFGSSAAKTLENVASLPGKGINAGKKAISNAGQRVNQSVRNVTKRGARAIGRGTARVAKAGAKKVFIAGGRLIGKDVKTETLSAAGKVIGKGAKTVGSKLGMVIKAPFRVFQFGSKIMSAFQAIMKKAVLILVKLLVGLFLSCGAILVLLAGFMALCSAVMFILEAVSSIPGKIKQDTSMAAAYEKLKEKESYFSSAIQSVTTTEEIPQEIQDEYGITQYSGNNVAYIDGTGGQATDTSTIKQILAMAAVYIEQDWNKYGAFFDGLFTDSVYKDYCAKLYDATHIIAVAPPNPDGSGIYYCTSETTIEEVNGEETEIISEDYAQSKPDAPAMENCNNKTEDIIYEEEYNDRDSDGKVIQEVREQWSARLEEMEKNYSAVIIREGRWSSKEDDWIEDDDWTVYSFGPHGKSGSLRDSNDKFDERQEQYEERWRENGCENFEWVHTGSGEDYDSYTLVCTCKTCKGHLDATTYVFISNIYDPSRDTANGEDSYNSIDPNYEEMTYSMYALDKYATAFDKYNDSGYQYMICSNEDCPNHTVYQMVDISEDEEPLCSACESPLISSVATNPGDKASCEEGDSNYSDGDRYQAEKAIMDSITGKDCTIIEWWNNNNWIADTQTSKTYFRLLDDGDITKAIKENEEAKKDAAEIENNQDEEVNVDPVVNSDNSTTYIFKSFTSSSGRNTNFEKHGWDKSSIQQVQLLLADDWNERYGMSDFGGISTSALIGSGGSSLTEEEIQQMLQNNTSWKDLCDDRKAIMATCLSFYSEIQRLGVPYHGAGCSANSIEQLQSATSASQYFGKGAAPICPKSGYNCSTQVGCDCSGFVSWILHQVFPNQIDRRETTSSLMGKVGTVLEPTSNLLPGDIALKNGHVLMYIGDGLWAEASGHSNGIVYGVTKSASYLSKYGIYRVSAIDETKHTINEEEEEETDESIDEEIESESEESSTEE